MKVCKKCGLEKDLSEFYKKPKMADGHLNHCITCVKAYEKNRREKVSDHLKAYEQTRSKLPHRVQARRNYAQTEAGKQAIRRANKAYKERYPFKAVARSMVNNALRDGKLTKALNCSECGCAEKIEGHHDNYTEPLNVRWLCEKCHKAWHKHNKPIYE